MQNCYTLHWIKKKEEKNQIIFRHYLEFLLNEKQQKLKWKNFFFVKINNDKVSSNKTSRKNVEQINIKDGASELLEESNK